MRNQQRLCKHGSSAAVVIPKPFLYAMNWVCGQAVMVEILEDGAGILVRLPRVEDFGPIVPPRIGRELIGTK